MTKFKYTIVKTIKKLDEILRFIQGILEFIEYLIELYKKAKKLIKIIKAIYNKILEHPELIEWINSIIGIAF